MNTYTLDVAGYTWTIGTPETAQPVTLKYRGKWPMTAVEAKSTKGVFLIIEYRVWEWRPEHRPFERDYWLVLDLRQRPVCSALSLHDALWVASGRKLAELDVTTTARLIDDPPGKRPWQRRQAQPQPRGTVHQEKSRSEWDGL